ncbi:MAG: arylsulfatase [Pirellulaceae bacterium]
MLTKNSQACRTVVLAFAAFALCVYEASAAQEVKSSRPNILVIMADDLGFSDVGCYGGEIATPNLDSLAAGGLRLTQFYNTARCWPSRASLLTGYYPQQVRRDQVPGVKSGNGGTRPAWARLLSELLQPLGYRSYHSGKWHVDGKPLENGFERSYKLDDHDRYFAPRQHSEDDRPLPAIVEGSDYYSSTAIADHAIKCLQEHANKHSEQPFFGFVAFTAPHFPLQARADDIARYRDRYLAGWDALRDERWQRIQQMGIGGAALSAVERDVGPPYAYPEVLERLGPNEVNRPIAWEKLTPDQKKFQATKMAIHAAMVDRMDQEIGRLLTQVRAMDALDNTLILFCSDNGASAEMMARGDGHDVLAEPGSGDSYLCLGPGWSSVANAPFRRHKTWVHEGGISSPLVVHWPQGIAARGETRSSPSHLIDLVPTILEAVGGSVADPKPIDEKPPLPGKSLLPLFQKNQPVEREALWWSHEGNRALRLGDWKIVSAGKQGSWELYDLSTDRSESRNLASDQPQKVRELAEVWERMTSDFAAQATRDASPPKPAKLIEVRTIWDLAPHNAFTDLVRFQDRWFCVFREGSGHVSADGALRVITSADGVKWESAALISSPNSDLRDAKISITPAGQLMLSGAEALHDTKVKSHQSLAWFSQDGRKWSERQEIGDPNFWLWRVNWHQDRAFSIGYSCTEKRSIRLYRSDEGKNFETLVKDLGVAGYPNETSVVFWQDVAHCLLRRDGEFPSGLLGTARAPFTEWSWQDLKTKIGGPQMIQLPDGRLVAAVRLYDKQVRTSLCWIDPKAGAIEEFLALPSGGDCSYAGMVYYDQVLWVSYYSSHEGKSKIYLAKVKLSQ